MGTGKEGTIQLTDNTNPSDADPSKGRVFWDEATKTFKQIDSTGTIKIITGLGYILATWGANLQNTGHYPQINGESSSLEVSVLGIQASAQVPEDGTIDTLTYYNATGDNTTVFKIIVNGAVAHTFTCVGPYGQEIDIGIPVAMVDNVAIEYDSGTKPANGIYTMYIN